MDLEQEEWFPKKSKKWKGMLSSPATQGEIKGKGEKRVKRERRCRWMSGWMMDIMGLRKTQPNTPSIIRYAKVGCFLFCLNI